MARAQHPGNQQAARPAPQSPYSANLSHCTALLDQCLPPNSLFYSREPEPLLFRLGIGLSLCKFTSNIQVSPTSVTKQEQPRKSIGPGLLGVPSGFISISSKPGLTSPSATSSACRGPCLPLRGGEGSSAALLGSCPQGCAHKQAPSTRPKPHRALLPLPTCSSLVQAGKNQAAPALPQRTSQ